MKLSKFVLSLMLCTTLPVSIVAQQQTPQPSGGQTGRGNDEEVVRVTTNLVQVDAVVTDKSGKIVTDLKPSEFEITEDGKPQTITNFSFIALENGTAPAAIKSNVPVDKNAPPVPPAPLNRDAIRRTFAFVVDDLGLSFQSTYYVRRSLKKFIDEQVQPGDLVAIVRTAGGVGALQQFTTDKQVLYAAIEKIRWYPNGRSGTGAFAPIRSDSTIPASDDTTGSVTSGGSSDSLEDFRQSVLSVGTLGALSYVVRGLESMPGRKAAVLFSDGLTITDRTPDHSGETDRTLNAMKRLVEQANRASVVVYTLDARGLVSTSLTAEDDVSSRTPSEVNDIERSRSDDLYYGQEGLIYLARETGGINIRNSNDLFGGLKKVVEDQKGFYLLGYKPDASSFDTATGRRRFHKLSIKVNRPGLSVRTRDGFMGVSDKEKTQPVYRTPAEQMLAALTSPFGESGINVRLTALFGDDAKEGAFVRTLFHIKASDLTFKTLPDGAKESTFQLLEMAFGDNGVPASQAGRTNTIRLKGATLDLVMKNGFDYILTFPIKKAGAYQMRGAVRDTESGRVGSASQFITVPDVKKNRLEISGIIVQGFNPRDKNRKSDSSSQSNGSEIVDPEKDPMAGPAVRQFRHGMSLEYSYLVYNAQTDKQTGKPDVETQVRIFHDGKVIFAGKPSAIQLQQQTDASRIPVGGLIQLGTELPPGIYQLQIIASDRVTKSKQRMVSQWIDFDLSE